MKRYYEFDYIRSLALTLMPIAHLLEVCILQNMIEPDAIEKYSWLLKIAGLAPAAFMFCLGVNIFLSRHNSVSELLKRSRNMLFVSFILNILRYLVPGAVASIVRNDLDILISSLCLFISSDILHFACLSFLFFALCRKLNIKPKHILLISVICLIADNLLPNNLVSEGSLLSLVLGNIFYIDYTSAFAFIQWLVFPSLGYCFASRFKKWEDENRFPDVYKTIILISALILTVSTSVYCLFKNKFTAFIGNQLTTYEVNLYGAFIMYAIIMALIGIAYFFSRYSKENKTTKIFLFLSRNITVYYLVQWILVTWVVIVLGVTGYGLTIMLSFKEFLFIAVLLTAASYALTLLARKLLHTDA